jgi:formylglycine-generating enzyme required for sulfatase activity
MIVDQMPKDVSPYGVMGMAGNVSEWTGDVVDSTRLSGVKIAVIRGANFRTNTEEHLELTYRVTTYPQIERDFWLGFRCASDQPVEAK